MLLHVLTESCAQVRSSGNWFLTAPTALRRLQNTDALRTDALRTDALRTDCKGLADCANDARNASDQRASAATTSPRTKTEPRIGIHSSEDLSLHRQRIAAENNMSGDCEF